RNEKRLPLHCTFARRAPRQGSTGLLCTVKRCERSGISNSTLNRIRFAQGFARAGVAHVLRLGVCFTCPVMRRAFVRGIGVLSGAAIAASCGWPKYGYDDPPDASAAASAGGARDPSDADVDVGGSGHIGGAGGATEGGAPDGSVGVSCSNR